MDYANTKAELRQTMRKLRSTLSKETHQLYSEEISRRTLEFIRSLSLHGNSLVLIYIPLHPEVDSRPIMEWLWREGIPTAAPITLTNPRRLEWRRITSYTDLQPGVWGIREPKPICPLVENPEQVSLILIPGLAFDLKGGRIGYGGGYYDRFLANTIKDRKHDHVSKNIIEYSQHVYAPKLAMAFDFQVIPQVPMEEHDIYIDLVITDKQMYLLNATPT